MGTVQESQDRYAAAKEALERETPQAWVWGEDGDELAGTLIGDDTGTTRDGDRVPIKLFRARDDAVRSLWLFESPRMLRELFAEHDPQVGDYAIVRRYPKRKTQDGERSYWPFAMAVVPASPAGGEGTTVAPPDGDDQAATQAALEAERDERDAMSSADVGRAVHAPLGE